MSNPGTIETAITFKKNLGNYENIDLHAKVTKQVEDIHDAEAWSDIWDEVDSQIDAKLKEVSGG